jgi:hypothetical protein
MASITNTDWNTLKSQVIAKATMDWPHPPPKDTHELMRALARVIEQAMIAGQTIGTNETAAHASTRRPIDGILPVLSSHR